LNITRYVDNPNFDKLAAIDDPYCMYVNKKKTVSFFLCYSSAYFDRYANTQIFQIEAAGDAYFLPDSEVTIEMNKGICEY